MGWMTIAAITNDAIDDIAKDPEIGPKIQRAVLRQRGREKVDVAARGHGSAIEIVGQLNNHMGREIAVFENATAWIVGRDPIPEHTELSPKAQRLIKELARELGYE